MTFAVVRVLVNSGSNWIFILCHSVGIGQLTLFRILSQMLPCMCGFHCVKSHTYMTNTHARHSRRVAWGELHLMHVQLSLNHRSTSSILPHFVLLFFLYHCCPSVPTVLLSPLCPPFSCLVFLLQALYIHDQLCVYSPPFILCPRHQLCLSSMNWRWHWFNPLKCTDPWEPAGPKQM